MLIQGMPVVVPTRLDFLLLLALIGIFGFVAQVSGALKVLTSLRQTDSESHKDPSDFRVTT